MELVFERKKKPAKFMVLMPMINVIFLLLTFFLVTGKDGAPDALAMTPPIASSGVALESQPITVLISAKGETLVSNQPVAPKDVMVHVARQLVVTPGVPVLLKADADVGAKQVLEMMRQLQQAGATKVAIAVQSGS